MKIVTNNVPRPVIDAYELTPKEREDFGYLDWEAIDAGNDSASFFRYRGELYDMGDIPLAPHDLRALGWDGAASDSFFSGMVVRYFNRDGYEYGTEVIVGRYFE